MQAAALSRPSFAETFGIVTACIVALVALAAWDKSAHDAHTKRATAALERMERERATSPRDETGVGVASTTATSGAARVERPGRVPIFIPHGGALGISPAAAITEDDYAPALPSPTTAQRRIEGPSRAAVNPVVSAIATAESASAPVAQAPAPAARQRAASPWFAVMAALGLMLCGAWLVLRRY